MKTLRLWIKRWSLLPEDDKFLTKFSVSAYYLLKTLPKEAKIYADCLKRDTIRRIF